MTITEMIVTATLIGILTATQAPNWQRFVDQQRVNTAANEIKMAIDSSKNESRHQGKRVMVSICTGAEGIALAMHPQGEAPQVWKKFPNLYYINATFKGDVDFSALTGDYTEGCFSVRPPSPTEGTGATLGTVEIVPYNQAPNSVDAPAPTVCKAVVNQTLIGQSRVEACGRKK